MRRPMLFRPVWLPTIITAGLLLVALALMVAMSWRNFQRLAPVHAHMVQINMLQEVALRLQDALAGRLVDSAPITPATLEEMREDLRRIQALQDYRDEETPQRLRAAQEALADLDGDSPTALIESMRQVRAVLAAETAMRNKVLHDLRDTTALELDVAIGTLITFPLLVALALFLLRRRIFAPLRTLAELMAHLTRRDYSAAHSGEVDPMLKPLIDNYNQLVGRLVELERENHERQQSLEHQVRAATRALLEQQRDLANAERLASVGEVTAGLAHELRNPLAGIQVALANLRRDAESKDHAQRLDLIQQEVARVVAILNDVLDRSRHVPEPAVDVQLADSVEEMLALARYQLPDGVKAENHIPRDLLCHLPERRTRQAVLNLVLNAAAAMKGSSGVITVDAESRNGQLVISVRDDGPGFPEHLLADAVRPFATGRADGTGLGLAMVRRFASDTGGDMRLSNRSPQGACVVLNLPCAGIDE